MIKRPTVFIKAACNYLSRAARDKTHLHNGSRTSFRCYSAGSSEDGTRLRIYTRTGDKGVTSTFSGQRLPKDDQIFEALGATDELTSTIGLARELCLEVNSTYRELILESSKRSVPDILQEVQCVLQDVASHVATPRDMATEKKLARTTFSEHHINKLEEWIDEMDDELPELKNFILPSGGKGSSSLHIARTICRRAERRVIPLYMAGQVEQEVAKYLNRLSDFLFTAARFVAHKEGKEEIVYQRIE